MTLDFQTFNLTQKAEGGGGSGTTNHAQLSNLDYANSGHTGFLSNENFIPENTVITVELDGTGDYTSLNDAVNYLKDKWSNGKVTIQLGEGTFVETEQINIFAYSIPILDIRGQSASQTIIKDGRTASGATTTRFLTKNYGNITLANFKVEGLGSNVSNYRAIDDLENYSGVLYIFGVSVDKSNIAISSMSYLTLGGTISISNCVNGISITSGACKSIWAPVFNFNTVTTAFRVAYGATIHLMGATCNYTSVTNKTNQAVGTVTNDGWITGVTV